VLRWTLLAPFVGAAVLCTQEARAADAETCASAAERAQPLRRAGRLGEALRELRTCAAAECPSIVRGECVTWLAEVEEALPTVVVRASSEAGDEVDVTVLADGHVIAEKLDGRPIALDPGLHEMRYERAGAKPASERVVLAAGEKNRVLRARFELERAPAPGARPVAPALVWWLGGVGLASAVAGTVFYAIGLGERSDMASTCAPQHACDSGRIHAAEAKLVVGDVLVGVGVVSLAAAAVVLLTAPRAHLDVRAFNSWK
jgi:hypothetical protein